MFGKISTHSGLSPMKILTALNKQMPQIHMHILKSQLQTAKYHIVWWFKIYRYPNIKKRWSILEMGIIFWIRPEKWSSNLVPTISKSQVKNRDRFGTNLITLYFNSVPTFLSSQDKIFFTFHSRFTIFNKIFFIISYDRLAMRMIKQR